MLQICDYGGNKLMDVQEKTPQAAVKELEELLPNFVEYRKLEIKGRENISTPWTKAFCWQLDFGKGEAKSIGHMPANNGSISALDYVGMMKDMMNENFKLQKDLLEKTVQFNNQDPSKWLPIINSVAPMLGLNAGGIQGPPEQKKALEFGDVDTSKMSGEEISGLIGEKLQSVSKKISGPQMLKIISALDNNTLLASQAENISVLLNAIISKPELLSMAMKFV